MGKKKSNKKKLLSTAEAENNSGVPRTFVVNRTKLGPAALELMLEMRRVMEPYTAASLKARKRNVLKDYVAVAGPLGITHFLLFSRTDASLNMRVCRLPRGPTLTFKIKKYSLMKDVAMSLRKPKSVAKQFLNPPLLVLNNFGADSLHVKLMQRSFQNMFPSINVAEVNISGIRRVALFNLNEETGEIEFRHYDISLKQVGLSKTVKTVLRSNLPDLSNYDDISEFVLSQAGYESDGDAMAEQVELPEQLRKTKSDQSAVKLTELGPRMNLQLLKIEDGLSDGKVLYHSIIHKTKAQEVDTEESRESKAKLKEKRRKQQEANIKRKEAEKEAHHKRSIAGQKKKVLSTQKHAQEQGSTPMHEDDDDEAYYREEVGEEPPEELSLKKTAPSSQPFKVVKRRPASKATHAGKPTAKTSSGGKRGPNKTQGDRPRGAASKKSKPGRR